MRYAWSVLFAGVFLGQLAAMDFAKAAVPRALNYEQGSRSSLIDVQDDFTPEGWQEFMKWLHEYVDDKGAPTGSSLFTSTGDAVVKSQEAGAIRLAIQGTLKQQSKNAYGGVSTTTYRVTVGIEVGGSPLKIRHLKTTTCGAKPCPE
jgi:hypothetical protein